MQPGKSRMEGTLGQFLLRTMHAYMRSGLPVPRFDVVEEFLGLGRLALGMGESHDWTRVDLSSDAYEAVCDVLLAEGAAARGRDPDWVSSLFFRRAAVLAYDRGTDAHHEIRRITIMRELARVLASCDDLSERTQAALRRRRKQANSYDFESPFELFD
jgi:hypothetical protein